MVWSMAKLDHTDAQSWREPAFFSLQISEARRFFAPLSTAERRLPLRVLGGGVERCRPDYRIERSQFEFVGVEFVARGSGSVRLGENQFTLMPGMAFCYDGSVDHLIKSDDQNPLVKYFVSVEGPGVKPLLAESGLLPGRVAYSLSPFSVLSVFDELIRSGMARPGARWRRCCGALFEALLCVIADTRMSTPPRAYTSPAFDTYLLARRELNQSALVLHSARELAERVGVSEAYLCRLFARFSAGQTPYRLLLQLKMEYAARRLVSEPGLLVKQIASEVGFTDPFSFSRAFRSMTGRSPLQVRSARPRD
jgi:AraC-like DNA-binding protein